MRDKEFFFQTFFPRWIGFCQDSFDSKIEPVEALLKLDSLVEGLSFVWTSTSYGHVARKPVNSGKPNFREVGLARN